MTTPSRPSMAKLAWGCAALLLACSAAVQAARVEGEASIGAPSSITINRRRNTPVTGGFKPPKWYHGRDGPIFDILQSGDDKELRHYHPTVWATTNITNAKVDDALDKGGKILDDYWAGSNVPHSKLDDTVPTMAILYIDDKTPRTVKSDMVTVQYFIPHELHDAPPAPSAEGVNVLKFGDQQVWVHSFGGYAHETEILDRAFNFLDELRTAKVDVRTDAVGFASYDKAYHLVNRHNEIWVWPNMPPSQAPAPTAQAEAEAEVGVPNEAVAAAKQMLRAKLDKLRASMVELQG